MTSPTPPPTPSLRDRIAALPEHAATSGRDFGRGYALAVQDVLALLGEHGQCSWCKALCWCECEDCDI